MGDDDDIIVASFFVRSQQAARDLMNWFEKGYDWVMDADVSPGEISPGRYLGLHRDAPAHICRCTIVRGHPGSRNTY
jgi:hypothetical protein